MVNVVYTKLKIWKSKQFIIPENIETKNKGLFYQSI